jgi:hypothetical protein
MTMHLVAQDIPTEASPAPAESAASPAHTFPSMDIHLPNGTLQAQVAIIVGSQYQLMGWMIGNNPASSPCLHEMAHWPLMSSMFNAGSTAFGAMQKQLSFFAQCGFAPSAYVKQYPKTCMPRFICFFNCVFMFLFSGSGGKS